MLETMIKFTDDREQIICLWNEVFHDSREDIEYFLDNCKNKRCLGFFENDTLVSMLFLIDCKYGKLSGKYLYAVCTSKESRNKGFAGKLIEEAKGHMKDFLWLIPANDGLFEYYAKYGFITKLYSQGVFENSIEFNENEDVVSEYLYDGSDFEFPKGMTYSRLDLPEGGTGLKR